MEGDDDTGREQRWADVYAHRERLLRLARARLCDPHEAEDCVQEAMLRCVEFEDLDEERLGQFLTTVTVRLCVDVHRRRARGDRLGRKLTGFWSHEPGPEESVCDRAESAWLARRLTDLTPRQREIVEARAEGLSCGAVAELLVVLYTTVESALARVRRSLRVALESTLGVVALRPRRFAAGALVATTAAITVTVPPPAGPVTSPPAARPAPAVAPPVPGSVAPARPEPHVAVAAAAPRSGVRVTVRAAVRPRPKPEAPDAGWQGGVKLPGGDDGVEISGSGETWEKFAARCLRNGVRVSLVVDCNHDREGSAP